jgi:hypothetical protein
VSRKITDAVRCLVSVEASFVNRTMFVVDGEISGAHTTRLYAGRRM